MQKKCSYETSQKNMTMINKQHDNTTANKWGSIIPLNFYNRPLAKQSQQSALTRRMEFNSHKFRYNLHLKPKKKTKKKLLINQQITSQTGQQVPPQHLKSTSFCLHLFSAFFSSNVLFCLLLILFISYWLRSSLWRGAIVSKFIGNDIRSLRLSQEGFFLPPEAFHFNVFPHILNGIYFLHNLTRKSTQTQTW